jgi:hypothetical protein
MDAWLSSHAERRLTATVTAAMKIAAVSATLWGSRRWACEAMAPTMTIANPLAAAGVRNAATPTQSWQENAYGAEQFTQRGDAYHRQGKRGDARLATRDQTLLRLADLRQSRRCEDRGEHTLQCP